MTINTLMSVLVHKEAVAKPPYTRFSMLKFASISVARTESGDFMLKMLPRSDMACSPFGDLLDRSGVKRERDSDSLDNSLRSSNRGVSKNKWARLKPKIKLTFV